MLLKIRGIIFLVLMITSMMLYCLVAVLGGIFLNEKKAYYTVTLWGRWVITLLKYVLGIGYKVQGAEYTPTQPCVVLSKHQSSLDIFVLLRVFDPQTWVFKRELFRIPCFGWALWATKPIAIDRNAGRQALKLMIENGKKKLKNGFFILLYPEGTRTKPGKRGVYKSGGVLLAQKAGVDIIPVAINTGLFWQKGKGVINNGVVDIVVGQPINTDKKTTKEITAEVEAWIEENTLAITLEHPYYLKMKRNEETN
ncbi:MAG: lysophospholipid acyltransferase family protein [Ostreibacterium sp.]